MAIKRPRKETKKPASAAAAGGSGSSLVMVEMPTHGTGTQTPPPLPPGVYFSPTKEECLGFLNRSIAGDSALPDARGYIFRADVYGESPDVLRQRHPPASTRDGDHTWWFLSQTRFQSQTSRSKRADRSVGTAGHWRLDQTRKKLDADGKKLDADGFKNCFGFYTGTCKVTDKTAWLMQEFTSAKDDGAGKQGMPALYRVYVTPHATDEQLRDIYGEDGIKKLPDGKKKPVRAMVPENYFDAVAKLLPPGSVRHVGQEHTALPPPGGLLGYSYGQQGQYLGPYQQQQGPSLGQDYQQQQGPSLGQNYQQQQQGPSLGQDYQQQQGPCSEVTPPSPPPAQLSVIAADASSDNLSMSMAEFMGMLNEEPAAVANEEPAEAVKEEPDWGSLDNIVDDDEFNNFNKED